MKEEGQTSVAEQISAPSDIPASPMEALEAITPKSDTPRNERGQFAAKERAEKAAAHEAAVDAQMRAEFPDLFPSKETGQEQPEAGAENPAEGSKKAKIEQPADTGEPTARQEARAIDWLKRAQISQARIDALSPAEKVAWAKEIKPIVVAQQQAAQQGKSVSKPEAIADQGAGSPAGEPPDSLRPGLKEAVEDLKKDVDPAVVSKIEKLLLAAVGPLEKQLAEAKAQVSAAGEAQVKEAVDASREALAERFPELADDEIFEEDVLPFMHGFASTGRFSQADIARLVEKAAVAAELEDLGPQAKQENETVARLKANGTASSRTRSAANKEPTNDERLALAAKLALDPRISIEEARRRVWGPS